MKERRFLLAAGLAGLAVSLSGGWFWWTLSQTRYEALAVVEAAFAGEQRDDGSPSIEDAILNPDTLSAAASLLQERSVSLPLASPFDSEADFLVDHIHVERDPRGEPGDFRIACRAEDADVALQVLSAVLDAWFAAEANKARPAPDAATGEAQTERRQIAEAIQRQERDIDAMVERLKAAGDPAAPGGADDLASLEGELIELRRVRIEAERHLEEARRDLIEKKIPIEAVVSRIAEGPLRSSVLERLKLARLHEDLQSQKALLQKWSSVYGKKHPRMAEVRARVELLDRQLSGAAIELVGFADRAMGDDLPSLVLEPFQRDLAARKAAEADLNERLDALVERLTARQEMQTRLGEARQELAFLHGEHDRVRKQIESSRRDETARTPQLIEAPVLSPDPIAPQAGLPIAASCLSGLALLAIVLRQFRAWRQAEPIGVNLAAAAPPVRRERFRSREEHQVRLKMLGAKG